MTPKERIDEAITRLLAEAKGVTLDEKQTDALIVFLLTHGDGAHELIAKKAPR